jgi:HAD superfamily hydrolase (TIGR01459 family)
MLERREFFQMKRHSNIDSLVPCYDAFLIDQFGTLHDGLMAYPGAAAALMRIRAAGRKVVLLSNSGRPLEPNANRLVSLGISPNAYDSLLTSGEVAARMINSDLVPAARGVTRCLLLERPGEASILDRLDFQSATPEAAQLVLIAGSEGDRLSLDWYAELLAPLARRGVPALCLNPDRTMLTALGLSFGAGRIAETYAALGGEVTWIGKPYPEMYCMALDMLGKTSTERVAGVGDSIEHDIAGARAAGCDAWLVRTGIIADWDDSAIEAEFGRWKVIPDGLLDAV